MQLMNAIDDRTIVERTAINVLFKKCFVFFE